jgi:hypothetical protein
MASRPGPLPLQDHAIDNLRFIRATMERAGSFTAVPGTGGIFMGLTALFAAMAAGSFPEYFLGIWMAAAGGGDDHRVRGHSSKGSSHRRLISTRRQPASSLCRLRHRSSLEQFSHWRCCG